MFLVGKYPKSGGMSEATCCFGLIELMPILRRLKTSMKLESSMNLNASSSGMKSKFPFVIEMYSRIPDVTPCAPPPVTSRALLKIFFPFY